MDSWRDARSRGWLVVAVPVAAVVVGLVLLSWHDRPRWLDGAALGAVAVALLMAPRRARQ